MTDEDDKLLRRLVHVTNILRARNLHCDVFDFDYGAIRHSSLDALGQRFLYVDFRRIETTSSVENGVRREGWSWYRPWVAGKVVKTEQQMIEHPILDSERKLCTVVHLTSTTEERLAPSGYFHKQLEVLSNIVRDENILPFVNEITSWVNEEANTIQVVQSEDDYSKLREGDCVMFLVYLTRDEYVTRSGELKRNVEENVLVEEKRVLADEIYAVDFGMTRDKSMEVEGYRVHCFSCKNGARKIDPDLNEGRPLHRKPFPEAYIGWIVGSIHSFLWPSSTRFRSTTSREEEEKYKKMADGSDWNSGGWGAGWGREPRKRDALTLTELPPDFGLSYSECCVLWDEAREAVDSPFFPPPPPLSPTSVDRLDVAPQETSLQDSRPGIVKRLSSLDVAPQETSLRYLTMTSDSRRGGFFFDPLHEWMAHAGKYQRAIHSTISWLQKESARASVRGAFVEYIIDATLFESRSISRVPPEIWSLIFEMAYGDRDSHWSPDSVLYTPVSVCRRWRDIMTTGEGAGLWSPIDFRGVSAVKCRARAAQLGYALKRGPVVVSISMDDVDPLISNSLHRLVGKDLTLTLNIHDFYSTTLRARLGRSVFRVQFPVPNVSKLTIEGGTFWTGEYPCRGVLPSWAETLTADETDCRWAWPATSRLNTLTLLWTVSPEHCFQMPWAQIESYAEMNTARTNGTLPSTHLENMANLRILCVSGVWLPTSHAGVVSLPRLEELSFVLPWRDVPVDGHFGGIRCPELRVLRLRGRHTRSVDEDQSARTFHNTLETFLATCPLLSTLSLALQIPYSGQEVVRHMHASPNLQSLYILAANRNMLDFDFVRGFADLSITPLLRTLVLQQGRYWDIDSEESVHEQRIAQEFVFAMRRRFESGLKVLSMPENGEGPYADVSTRHELWEASASWDWVDDRWGIGGIKVSSILRENLLALGISLNVIVDLDSPFR
ncbi:hypothetical protein R3P38DRAFT_3254025 [Favolaschia claudopus]|uniref:F-box domain-containing protein n=1 Tax=Favolaschia claudopus TaxID=2862362 RepID=A0AAW0DW34_9AGAR